MRRRTRTFILISLFSALTAAGAFIRIPMPLVPMTLQTLLVYLSGLFLGPAGGALSQLIYMAIGLAGFPVFSGGGGIVYVFSPTFGYLLGFIPAAAAAGYLSRKGGRVWPICGVLCAVLVVYAFGVPYLILATHCFLDKDITLMTALKIGFLLPLIGDSLKAAAALAVFFPARKRLGLPLGTNVWTER
jgi:biotin transport system substrate-specific component